MVSAVEAMSKKNPSQQGPREPEHSMLTLSRAARRGRRTCTEGMKTETGAQPHEEIDADGSRHVTPVKRRTIKMGSPGRRALSQPAVTR